MDFYSESFLQTLREIRDELRGIKEALLMEEPIESECGDCDECESGECGNCEDCK